MKNHTDTLPRPQGWHRRNGLEVPAPHLLDRNGEPFNSGGESQLNGRQLRQLRRSRGLSQVELAELLGVTQPNISRWEAGFEQTPLRIRGRLKDILTGHKQNAAGFYSRVARFDPNLAAYDVKPFSIPIIKLSQPVANMLSEPAENYIGKDFRRIFKSDWLDDLFQGRPLSDYALVHLNHDLVPEEPNPRISAYRSDVLLYIFQPEDSTPMIIGRANFSEATGEPARIVNTISLDEF